MSTTTSTQLYYWLLAPKAQGGEGRTVLGAERWLREWDGESVPEGFEEWSRGTMAP